MRSVHGLSSVHNAHEPAGTFNLAYPVASQLGAEREPPTYDELYNAGRHPKLPGGKDLVGN
jgi:hypothetical protein